MPSLMLRSSVVEQTADNR